MMVIVCGSDKWVNMVTSEIKQSISVITISTRIQLMEAISKYDSCGCIYIAEETWLPVLLEQGVQQTRIIHSSLFEKLDFENPIIGFNEDFDSILFGMSHAQCGVLEKNISISRFYKEAAPSLDLFLHLKYLKLLCELHENKIHKIQYYIFELPYYIFNYDLSRFGDFCYTKLNYFDQVNDYHHLGEKESQKKMISLFQYYKDVFIHPVFFNKIVDENHSNNESLLRKTYRFMRKCVKIILNRDNVWHKRYDKTIAENKKIWDEIQSTIRDKSPNAQIIVLIMPYNPLFRITHKAVISQQKKIFFQNIGCQTIIDDFYWSHNIYDFKDHCHLKDELAETYTKHLDERLRIMNLHGYV